MSPTVHPALRPPLDEPIGGIVEAHHSYRLSRVRSKNTRPERVVRSILHRMGYRYRCHAKQLPGIPDLLFTKRRVALFVHGCFWHRHNCGRASVPLRRTEFWADKFHKTMQRDMRTIDELNKRGWRSVVVWECELRCRCELEAKLVKKLGPPKFESAVPNVR